MTENLTLIQASSKGDLALVKKLVEGGADINSCDYDDRTPLHLAGWEWFNCSQLKLVEEFI